MKPLPIGIHTFERIRTENWLYVDKTRYIYDLITTGSAQITERSIRWLLKYATRLSGKTFAKFIPFIGAFIGFAVNYSITRTTGEVAMQWYNNKQKQG